MRKKNLTKNTSYFFRVRPHTPSDDYVASLPSAALSLCEISSQVSSLVGGASATLVNARGEVVSAASLAGKVVGFYCSASWCGPCRSFTPRLAQVRLCMCICVCVCARALLRSACLGLAHARRHGLVPIDF